MSGIKQLKKALDRRLTEKQNEFPRYAGEIGDDSGSTTVSGKSGFVYVTINGMSLGVISKAGVPSDLGAKVWVGYSPEEPELFQVLSLRSDSPNGNQTGRIGSDHALSHEWLAEGGGQDPVHIDPRAISFLKIGTSATGGLNIRLEGGTVYNGARFFDVNDQDIDLTAQLPVTPDVAALVMITIDTSGNVIQTKGAEVNIYSLTQSYRPAVPANTAFVCGCVRVYYGKTIFQETRKQTDFDDLRFGFFSSAVGSESLFTISEDLTAQIDGIVSHFTTSVAMSSIPNIYCNIRQLPSAYTIDVNRLGFTLSYVPTIYDHLIVDYYVSIADILTDSNNEPLWDGDNNYLIG